MYCTCTIYISVNICNANAIPDNALAPKSDIYIRWLINVRDFKAREPHEVTHSLKLDSCIRGNGMQTI